MNRLHWSDFHDFDIVRFVLSRRFQWDNKLLNPMNLELFAFIGHTLQNVQVEPYLHSGAGQVWLYRWNLPPTAYAFWFANSYNHTWPAPECRYGSTCNSSVFTPPDPFIFSELIDFAIDFDQLFVQIFGNFSYESIG